MNTTNHTPGPWFLRPSLHNVTGATITTESGAVISTARNQDDARLIASAPDLLDALEGLYAAFPDCHADTITCRHGHFAMETPRAGIAAMVARAAIAKARGEG